MKKVLSNLGIGMLLFGIVVMLLGFVNGAIAEILIVGFAFFSIGLGMIQYAGHMPYPPVMLDDHSQGKKQCPDCAEWIQEQARICRFCGHQFQDNGRLRRG